MLEMRACHLGSNMVFFYIGIDHHGTERVAIELIELGGGE